MHAQLIEPLTLFKLVKTYTNLHEGAYPELDTMQTARLTQAFDAIAQSMGLSAYTSRPKPERFNYEKSLFLGLVKTNARATRGDALVSKEVPAYQERGLQLSNRFKNGDANRFMLPSFKSGELVGRMRQMVNAFSGVSIESKTAFKEALNAMTTTLVDLLSTKGIDIDDEWSPFMIGDSVLAIQRDGDQFFGGHNALQTMMEQMQCDGFLLTKNNTKVEHTFSGSDVLATLMVHQFGDATEKSQITAVAPTPGVTLRQPTAHFASFQTYDFGMSKGPATQKDAVIVLKFVNELQRRLSHDETHDYEKILPLFEKFRTGLNFLYGTNQQACRAVFLEKEKQVGNELLLGA